jgi:uncharacterized protein (UPF0332 family)
MTEKDKAIYRKMERAKATLAEVKNLIEFKYYNTSVNRLYYASFYAVQALLTSIDVFPKTHKGVLNMFSLHFVKENKIPEVFSDYFAQIFNERELADYADKDEIEKEAVEEYFAEAVKFINHIDTLLKAK